MSLVALGLLMLSVVVCTVSVMMIHVHFPDLEGFQAIAASLGAGYGAIFATMLIVQGIFWVIERRSKEP